MIGQKEKNKLVVPKEEKACVERYFFKYAFPCAQVKLKLGSLTKERYDELERIFFENGFPERDELERAFPPAFRRIRDLAEEMNCGMWNPEVMEEYWTKNHNKVIDDGDGMYGIASEEFKDLCKVQVAEVADKSSDGLVVRYDGKERKVSDFLVRDVFVGDKVRIHFAFAIEKV